ncbi:MAG TPA: hypothetical protein PKC49_08240 [Phycisphaerae bacterium]|nr:hypothetical protein [Phycisphaerae bacterium]
MNGDGVVDNADWELCEGLPDCSVCDVSWDGAVDEADLKIIDDEIGSACPGSALFRCASGTRSAIAAYTTIPIYGFIQHALPSFADVDGDGDLDCARSAWGTGVPYVKFYRNNLYVGDCGDCDESTRRYLNIRPVRGAPDNGPKGSQRDYTENEFGARVELVIRNDPNEYTASLRRVQFTASSAGYLNQNEYPLHFGLPPDPDPNDPDEDLHFDVYVDLPTRADEPNDGSGVWRVDWTVNPQLADINLADLYVDCRDASTLGRPITVYRDGRVRFKGADPNYPADPNLARLYTLGGPLRLPAPGAALPGLTSGSVLAGIRFIKEPTSPELRVREFIVDGQLDQTTYGCAYNLVVLDMTDPNNPDVVGGLKARTFTDNQRTFIQCRRRTRMTPTSSCRNATARRGRTRSACA